jgi:hypothetical protein
VLAGEALHIEQGSTEHFAVGALIGAGAVLLGDALEEGHPLYGFGGRGEIGSTSARPSSDGIGGSSARPSSDGIGGSSARPSSDGIGRTNA